MGRSTALRTLGIAVMYAPDDDGVGWRVLGREGTERERRAEVALRDGERSFDRDGGPSMAVAVAEEAVVEDWDGGEGMAVSSRVLNGGWGWPYWTSWAVKERGRVWVARSKPAMADSTPGWRKPVVWDVVRVRSLALAFRWCSFAGWLPLMRGVSEKGGRPCHISQKTRWSSISCGE